MADPSSTAPRIPARTRVLCLTIKTLIWLVIFNVVFALLDPIPSLGKLSLYNILFPGRDRLPYGDDPTLSFNITLNQLDGMFASHRIHLKSDPREYRVVLLGDSSIWGFLQDDEETLSAQLNQLDLQTADGRDILFYNLGYPTLSLTKDLLLLEYAGNFQPDLVLWFITLESFPIRKQLESPLLSYNPEATQALLQRNGLILPEAQEALHPPDFWEKTVIGRRRVLADLIRHQVYGILWTATGVDQYLPEIFDRRAEDLEADVEFQGMAPDQFSRADMAFDVLEAGINLSAAPVVLVNEPIFISDGLNSDIRYNFYYPVWAYDAYLTMLKAEVAQRDWELINIWNTLPGERFTDSAIHYDKQGVKQVVVELLSSPELSFMKE